jgi:predicted transport protein
MAKSPEDQTATMIANCKEKTGKTLDQWLKITRSAKLSKHGEIVKLLKSEHGVTHGFANLIAHKTLESDAGSSNDQDLITLQYASGKEALRPIYDALISAVQKFGNDVEISPKKAYVSLRRNKQFAIIQPSTKTRVDVGLNLKSTDPQGRLEASGSFNSMVTHRVRIEDVKQVDKELVGWLKKAYEQS